MNLSHWQSTALALLGFLTGLALHLRWHPLRRHLSDAWDFVRLRPALTVWVACSALLGAFFGGEQHTAFTLAQLTDWRGLILPLALDAAAHLAALPHSLFQPWPLACVAPFILVVLTVRVWRWPYRYGERRPVPEQKIALLVVTFIGFGWLGLEAAALRRMPPEALEMPHLGLRHVFTALMAAGMQVWLARFVMAWENPQDTEAESDATDALEHAFARWQGVGALAGFNLLWMIWRMWHQGTPGSIGGMLWVELLLLFAALPLAVAAVPGHFPQQGAAALRVLLRASVPLLLLAVTALAVMILALYTQAMARALCADSSLLRVIMRPLGALVLAMLDCWLLLTALLIMLRHGLPRTPSA